MTKHSPTHSAVPLRSISIAAITLVLCACGGGSGAGLAPLVTTPPPVQQPAPPPATPGPATISAPAAATAAMALTPIMATAGGPTIASTPGETRFPMLQTTLVFDSATIRPDLGINASGGSASIENSKLQFAIGAYVGEARQLADANLDWTSTGYWSGGCGHWDYGCDPGVSHAGIFVIGYQTPASDMPSVGTATYSGSAEGHMYVPLSFVDALPCKCQAVPVQGDASFTADFGARTITGELTNMVRIWWDESAWNNVLFSSTIAGNSFSGTTRVTAGLELGMAGNAAGSIEGRFFGPSAQEAGAVWTLFDGTRAAIGTLSAKRP